jgi:hypothetical protein
MRDAYDVRGLSLREMAVEGDCSLATVARWMRIHGIPTDPDRQPRRRRGADHPQWKGGPLRCPQCGKPCTHDVTMCMDCRRKAGIRYGSVHDQVQVTRGHPSQHTCAHCTEAAAHWAYDHEDPSERLSPEGWPYSFDLSHYLPLCVRCHRAFDVPPPPHGTNSRYTNQKCRCEDCRMAAREYRRDYHARTGR